MTYEQKIIIPASVDKETWTFLNSPRGVSRQPRDQTISVTARFPDGIEMDIKCCPADSGSSWSEAVLFNQRGGELCCTDPDSVFTGVWELDHDGNTYKAVVEAENAGEPGPAILVTDRDENSRNGPFLVLQPVDYRVTASNAPDCVRDALTEWMRIHPDDRPDGPVVLKDVVTFCDSQFQRAHGFLAYLADIHVTDSEPADEDASNALCRALLTAMLHGRGVERRYACMTEPAVDPDDLEDC